MHGRPWFRPRKFGWGWRPTSWQGWLVVFTTVAILAAAGLIFQADSLAVVIVLTYMAALAVILYFRGGPGK